MEKENVFKKLGIRLLSDRVLVEINKDEVITESGFILSNNDSIKSGSVVLVGKGKRNKDGEIVPVDIEVGCQVTFQYGTEMKFEGKTYTLVTEEDVITVKE